MKKSMVFLIVEIISLIISLITNIFTNFSLLWLVVVMVVIVAVIILHIIGMITRRDKYIYKRRWKDYWRTPKRDDLHFQKMDKKQQYDKIKQQIKMKILYESNQEDLLVEEIKKLKNIQEKFPPTSYNLETLIKPYFRIKKGEITKNLQKYYESIGSAMTREYRVFGLLCLGTVILIVSGILAILGMGPVNLSTYLSPFLFILPIFLLLFILYILVANHRILINKTALFSIIIGCWVYILIIIFLVFIVSHEFQLLLILSSFGLTLFEYGYLIDKSSLSGLKCNLFYHLYAFQLLIKNNYGTNELLINYFKKSVDAFNDILKFCFKIKIINRKKILFNFIINPVKCFDLFENEDIKKFFKYHGLSGILEAKDIRGFSRDKQWDEINYTSDEIIDISNFKEIGLIKNKIETISKEFDITDYKWYKDPKILALFGTPLPSIVFFIIDFLLKLPIM